MADSRIKDLEDEIVSSELDTLLDTLYIAADDGTFTDAHKVLWKNLLYSGNVSGDAETNNYQALTPKAFHDSSANNIRRGTIYTATGEAVTNMLENTSALTPSDLPLIHENERERIFEKVGQPTIYWKNTKTAAWEVNQEYATAPYYSTSPIIPEGLEEILTSAAVQISIKTDSFSVSGFYSLTLSQSINIASGCEINLRNTGELRVLFTTEQTNVYISAFITATVE